MFFFLGFWNPKKPGENEKKETHLLSQNQTLSSKFFFCFFVVCVSFHLVKPKDFLLTTKKTENQETEKGHNTQGRPKKQNFWLEPGIVFARLFFSFLLLVVYSLSTFLSRSAWLRIQNNILFPNANISSLASKEFTHTDTLELLKAC